MMQELYYFPLFSGFPLFLYSIFSGLAASLIREEFNCVYRLFLL